MVTQKLQLLFQCLLQFPTLYFVSALVFSFQYTCYIDYELQLRLPQHHLLLHLQQFLHQTMQLQPLKQLLKQFRLTIVLLCKN